MTAFWHWLLQVTGNMTAGTRWNLAWAGFLSAGVISTGIFTGTFHKMRQANCHNKGCWRIGHHLTPEGYKLCKKCVARPVDDLELHPIHPHHRLHHVGSATTVPESATGPESAIGPESATTGDSP
jgi:hypothetical protein